MPPLLDKNNKHRNKLMLPKNLHLQLSGSQISLSARPQAIKKASVQSAKAALIKRPMSATPGLGYTNRIKRTTPSWTRPQSADNCTGISRGNKLAARFNSLNTEEDQDFFRNLGATYTVSSSNLLQSLMGSSSLDVPIDSDISITPSPRLTSPNACLFKTDDVKDELVEFSKVRDEDCELFQGRNSDINLKDGVNKKRTVTSEDRGSNLSLVPGLEPGLASKPPLPPPTDTKTMKYNLSTWSSVTETEGPGDNVEDKAMNDDDDDDDDDIINLKFQRWFPDSVLNSGNYSSMDQERISKVNIDMKHLFSNSMAEKANNFEITDSESVAGSRNSLSEGEFSEELGIKQKSKKYIKGEKGRKMVSTSLSQGKEIARSNRISSVKDKRLTSKSYVRSKETPTSKLNQSMPAGNRGLERRNDDTSKIVSLKNYKTDHNKKSIHNKISLSPSSSQKSDVNKKQDDFAAVMNNTDLHTSIENFSEHPFDYDSIKPSSDNRPSTSATSFSNSESLFYNSSTPINPTEIHSFHPDNSTAKNCAFNSMQDGTIRLNGNRREQCTDINSRNVIGNNDKSLVPCISVTDLSMDEETKTKQPPVRLFDDNQKRNYLVVPVDVSSSDVEPMSSNHMKNYSLNDHMNQPYFDRESVSSPLQDNFFTQAELSNAPVTSSSRSIIANFCQEDDGMRKFIKTSVAVSECLVKTVKGDSCKRIGQMIHNNSVLNSTSTFEPSSKDIRLDNKGGVECNNKDIEESRNKNSKEGYETTKQTYKCYPLDPVSFKNNYCSQTCHGSNSLVGLLNENSESEKEILMPRDCRMHKLNENGRKDENSRPTNEANYVNEIPERDKDCLSTYDDIVNILKVLEQEEGKQTPFTTHNAESVIDVPQKINDLKGSTETSQAILSYLDEVNRSSELTLKRNPQQTSSNNISASLINDADKERMDCRGRLGNLLSLPTPELAQCVMNLSLELEERIEAKQATEEQLKVLQTSFENYKSETKAALERHQKFIDQLIHEKKKLSEKCATVIKDMESKQAHAIKVLEDRHVVELKKACERQAATDKIKRERWIDLKTKKIKELTVKGLEPELNRMAAVHQEELSELRRIHQHQMEEAEAAASRRLASVRMQFEADKEAALIQERDIMRRRVEQETTDLEKSYQDQRKRMINELRAEREQIQRENAHIILEKEKELLQKFEKISKESHDKYESQEKRFQEELERMRGVMEAEKDAWIVRQKTSNNEKEKQLREELKRERDKHIEVAIRKIEAEASVREEAAESKLKREKEKFECELKDMENVNKELRDKLKQLRTEFNLTEQQNSRLASDLKQAVGEIESLKVITERLAREKHEIQLEGEEVTRNRVSRLERDLAQARLALREQMNSLQNEKEMELQQVYRRVREAIAKKDDTINLMLKERDAALEQCAHLEKLMEQQRKEMLKRKAK